MVSVHVEEEQCVIRVRDHGSGVPEPARAQLFDRFSSSDRSPLSVGLGLWIVRLLAQAHGGTVAYEPAHPGAAFVVTLPQPRSGDRPSPAPRERPHLAAR